MYEQHFGFNRTPFARDLPPDKLFVTPGFEELLARLKYAAERKMFVLVTGEVGAGKSTAIRALIAKLNPTRYRVLYDSDSALTPRNFYWLILHQLNFKPHFYRSDAKRQLQQAVEELENNQSKTPVVILDEAHLLGMEMLEEIRFLPNFQVDSYSPLSLVLVGQPELRRILQLQVYEAIAQRINVRFHLPAFELAESIDYIRHHLRVAGVHASLFTEEAMSLIHEFTGGIARKINNVCTACLLSAFLQRKSLVDDHMVKLVTENEFAA